MALAFQGQGMVWAELQGPGSILISADKAAAPSWVWWFICVIPALGSLRQENCEFQANLGYIVKSYKIKTKTKNKKARLLSSMANEHMQNLPFCSKPLRTVG
jgi:hypothetical protein